MKVQWDKGGKRVLLGDDGLRACCGPLGSSVLEFGFQLDPLVYLLS